MANSSSMLLRSRKQQAQNSYSNSDRGGGLGLPLHANVSNTTRSSNILRKRPSSQKWRPLILGTLVLVCFLVVGAVHSRGGLTQRTSSSSQKHHSGESSSSTSSSASRHSTKQRALHEVADEDSEGPPSPSAVHPESNTIAEAPPRIFSRTPMDIDPAKIQDVAVIGAGPAGLTAAMMGARAGLDTIVLGSSTGLLSETPHLDNFPSFVHQKSGPDWLEATKSQALHFGATFATPGILVTDLTLGVTTNRDSSSSSSQKEEESTFFALATTANGESNPERHVYARSVIVASGASSRRLGLANEGQLWGKSLHNCAICDGHLYQDQAVVVVGGGDSAMDAAILLARYASQVYVVHRRSNFSGKNQAAVQVAEATSNIKFLKPYVVTDWLMDEAGDKLTGARLTHGGHPTEHKEIAVSGAFVMIGADPNTKWLQNDSPPLVELEADGLIRLFGATETSLAGVFATGEVVDSVYKQAVTAAASGAQASIDAERWLREHYGVHPKKAPAVSSSAPDAHEKVKDKESAVAREARHIPEENPPSTKSSGKGCDLTTAACIEELVAKHPVVVFSKSWCPYCRKAMEALAIAGVPTPFVVDLTDHPNAQGVQQTLKTLTNRRTVPNVFVGGTSIGGGDETVALQSQGKLVPLLIQAGALEAAKQDPVVVEEEEAPVAVEGGEDCNLLELSCIESIIQKYPVVMFSLEWCPECKRSLELLSSIGAKPPHIIDLDDYKEISQDIRYHMMTISKRHSVPNLFIAGENFGGFNKMSELHQEGKLVAKLTEVGWIAPQQQ